MKLFCLCRLLGSHGTVLFIPVLHIEDGIELSRRRQNIFLKKIFYSTRNQFPNQPTESTLSCVRGLERLLRVFILLYRRRMCPTIAVVRFHTYSGVECVLCRLVFQKVHKTNDLLVIILFHHRSNPSMCTYKVPIFQSTEFWQNFTHCRTFTLYTDCTVAIQKNPNNSNSLAKLIEH